MDAVAAGPQRPPPGTPHPAGAVSAIALAASCLGDGDRSSSELHAPVGAFPTRLYDRGEPSDALLSGAGLLPRRGDYTGHAVHQGQGAAAPTPPRYAKIEFATYDGVDDPLNWLNQCEQFFRGQRTLASDRTWLASYHLRGAAQTWYYSLEQDEGGMPPWDRFRDLCLLRFGPPIRGSRLAELGRLPFTNTVQDFADCFQALACHAPGVTGQQRAELFVGGLPDYIRVDVELQAPQDLQTAMHLARAYERRAQAVQPVPPARGGRPTRPLPTVAPATRPAPTGPASPAPAATRTFRRLTPAEQLERRRLGLCFNCDEPYAPGHVCPRLFYMETVDADDVDGPPEAADTLAPQEPTEPAPPAAKAFVVSLHALAGIRHERTMLLPVTIHGETLVALLDTGSTHNFMPAATMHRLALQPTRGITSTTSWAEHLQHIAIVFNELRAHHLHLKRSKCSFATTSVAYLGHVITADGVAMDADKVASVATWPTPRSPRALRGFLGLAGYYRKFIRDFGLIASPLTRLLRRDAFTWDDEATTAFEALKGALTTGPVLQMLDFDRPFVVDCDASGSGFGAVLHQGDGPLAYFSRPFAARHLKLAAYEQELIGLV
uniref:Uncharacterized protein n=1 Tax=Avena sativa TaxID=4498 RepID=A0ACD5T6G6_AVESA